MFGRGSRFPPAKVSDIPGPGAYDPEDPKYDTYKRGAFLEKQDRFSKLKPSEAPGPGTYNTAAKPDGNGTMKAPTGDRYAILQRKLEDLERVHEDGKREHKADVERLKLELARAQRTNTETNDRLEKLKKQNEVQDGRIQELKKTTLSDQLEIKDLRAKLRLAENEKAQLSSKQGEAADAKKAMHAAETKRKEELREKDRKIAELERAVAAEKEKRESAETNAVRTRGEISSELQEARAESRNLRGELREAKSEADKAQAALVVLRSEAEETEEELLEQLDSHRAMLARVAQEYARLASSAVSKETHERVKHESLALQLRVNKLERKSANTESQVAELANFIRHTQEQNVFLAAQLRDAEEQLAYYAGALRHASSGEDVAPGEDSQLARLVYDVGSQFRKVESERRTLEEADNKLWAEVDELRLEQLQQHTTLLQQQIDDVQHLVDKRAREADAATKHSSRLSHELSSIREEHEATKKQLIESTSSLAVSRAREEELKQQIEVVREEEKTEVAKVQKLVKQEKEATQRLAGLVTQGKKVEEALSEDIDRLTAELAEAEQYREAYLGMIDEVDALVRRNALAEDEAAQLSKFNAQILGHNNPQQRIMYVDKIRGELHEVKQTLLMTTKDKEAVQAENDELRRELELYKSVGVPAEVKPRTFVTRVSRTPLANHNLNSSHARSVSNASGHSKLAKRYDSGSRDGDMTVDELDV